MSTENDDVKREAEEAAERMGVKVRPAKPNNPAMGGRQWADHLTEGQERFCYEYLKDYNKSAAYIRAGYSPISAGSGGSELYRMPKVRARIADLIAETRKEYAEGIDRLRKEVARIAFSDITDLIDAAKHDKPGAFYFRKLTDIPKRVRPAIKSIKNGKYGIEITFHEKTAGLEMLAKHYGMYEADNKQRTPGVGIYIPDNGRNDRTPAPAEETDAAEGTE